MKLKQYLKEFQDQEQFSKKGRVNKITIDDARDMLQRRCKKALNDFMNGDFIQRYTSTARSTDFGFLDSSKTPARLSRNTLNYYTLIINDDPIWKAYPRRQVIASLIKDKKDPTQDSGILTIFPFDETKVGFCNSEDMWDSWPYLRKAKINARRFNEFIKICITFNHRSAPTAYDFSLSEFKKACKIFDQVVKKHPERFTDLLENFPDGFMHSVKTLKDYDGDFYKFVMKYYNPNGFKLGQPGSYVGRKWCEIWLDGPAIFINQAYTKGFIDRMRIGQDLGDLDYDDD